MTADEVRHAAAAGIEVGSHSLTHRRLPGVGRRALVDEVRQSRTILGDLTGQGVRGFCYPYGGVGAREIEAVRDAGYEYACAVGAERAASPHAIPRTFVGDRDTSLRLSAKRIRHGLRSGR
jgi:peptidoglycan/xylan/chitin deacetylase (PgdA/CDA1 family)